MEIIEAIVAITTFVEERGYDYQAKAWWTIRAYIDKLASSGEVSPPPTTASTQAGECDQHNAGQTCSYEPDSGKCGEEPCQD